MDAARPKTEVGKVAAPDELPDEEPELEAEAPEPDRLAELLARAVDMEPEEAAEDEGSAELLDDEMSEAMPLEIVEVVWQLDVEGSE